MLKKRNKLLKYNLQHISLSKSYNCIQYFESGTVLLKSLGICKRRSSLFKQDNFVINFFEVSLQFLSELNNIFHVNDLIRFTFISNY